MMLASMLWTDRLRSMRSGLVRILWVVVLYLASELVIWGLSVALDFARVQFFSSILAMVTVFVFMTLAHLLWRGTNRCYLQWVKDKVDFINIHLGVGFPIPIIMLNQGDLLGGHQIASIIGNFVVTNLLSWTIVFGFSILCLMGVSSSLFWISRRSSRFSFSRPLTATPQLDFSWVSDSVSDDTLDGRQSPDKASTSLATSLTTTATTARPSQEPKQSLPCSSKRASLELLPLTRAPIPASSHASHYCWWSLASLTWPSVLALACTFLVGAPVQAATGDGRVLDGCVLWLVWITSVSAQRGFKRSHLLRASPRAKSVAATLMNPVLATTLLMMGYTHAKAAAINGTTLDDVLSQFSSGIPLWYFWSHEANTVAAPGTTPVFGAGDAALSILECGILIWGFKLYECRLQLFSLAGLLTAALSMAAAAANVFLCVLSGTTMGLAPAEALAFAARSTTLALAKPAVQAVGGNLAVNAALVVSNGILGQLVYPFALPKIGVQSDCAAKPAVPKRRVADEMSRQEAQPLAQEETERHEGGQTCEDTPITIAAGIAIGVNGAAMGVAYLYETRSRAAPYAALSMTVFGVMTVVFTTVQPFRGVLMDLAGL